MTLGKLHAKVGVGGMKRHLAEGEKPDQYEQGFEGWGEAIQEHRRATEEHTQHGQAFTPHPLDEITSWALEDTYDALHRSDQSDLEGGDVELRPQ